MKVNRYLWYGSLLLMHEFHLKMMILLAMKPREEGGVVDGRLNVFGEIYTTYSNLWANDLPLKLQERKILKSLT